MILDQLKNLENYASLHPAMDMAAAFVKRCEKENLGAGTYELDGRNVYAVVQEYQPQEKEDASYETHDRYLDIQCMLLGSEYQWYAPRETLEEKVPYQPEKDVTRYHFQGSGSRLELAAGSFAVYFPQDGHLPAMKMDGVKKCKRVVIKAKC